VALAAASLAGCGGATHTSAAVTTKSAATRPLRHRKIAEALCILNAPATCHVLRPSLIAGQTLAAETAWIRRQATDHRHSLPRDTRFIVEHCRGNSRELVARVALIRLAGGICRSLAGDTLAARVEHCYASSRA
jgi:hypothetical protein